MQQRQPRLGDILDDYCPRERRLTNHAIVAMVGDDVKQTRCTTCDAEHEYKHAKVPRQRKKSEQSTLYSQVLAGVTPKKVTPPPPEGPADAVAPEELPEELAAQSVEPEAATPASADLDALFDVSDDTEDASNGNEDAVEEGPAHRRLIRAQLPRHEGQVSTARQTPDFTIRQPANARPNRFRGRQQRGGAQLQGNRGGGNGNTWGGGQRHGGRPQNGGRQGNRQGPGRNRSK